jgi:hypothetical protein
MKSLRSLLHAKLCDKVPPGWLTRDELAAAEGISADTGNLRHLIKQAKAAGLLEEKEFRVPWGNIVRPRAHYRRTSK